MNCRLYIIVLACALVAACTPADTFRLSGEFTGLRQVDLYIYATGGSMDHVDTIRVVDGYFEWETHMTEPTALQVVFPNMSELTVLAEPGTKVKMHGDGSQLKLTRIEGTPDNDELTKFRLTHANDAQSDLVRALEEYVRDHADTRVGLHLQRQLMRINADVAGITTGRKLPAIDFPDDHLSPYDSTALPRHPMLLIFWAGWSGGSHEMNVLWRKHMREHASDSLPTPVSISLDTDHNLYRMYCRQDSITWSTRCYRLIWDTPQAYALAIRQLPYAVLTDSAGIVLAHGSNWQKDIEPKL